MTNGFKEELESDIPADMLKKLEVHPLSFFHTSNPYFPKKYCKKSLKEISGL